MRFAPQRKLDSADTRVDFFVVGAQKAGTTALDQMLRRHPALGMANAKEVHFFDREEEDWDRPDYLTLHEQFDWGRTALRGEATPVYLYWPNSIERLWAYNPSAKIVVGLRHPVFRAYSHWRMEVSREAETLSFADAIREGRQRVRAAPGGVHRTYSYVERGYYDEQIERLLRCFPRSQIFFFKTDELYAHPDRVLRGLWRFLDVDEPTRPINAGYVAPVANRVNEAISDADRRLLECEYADRYGRIEQITGLDITDWLALDYAEPMHAPGA